MLEIIKEIDVDIQRCENVINKNDYLEIVITIEELNDKYMSRVKNLFNSNNVWNYNKGDLKNIESHLRNYKNEIIRTYEEEKLDNEFIELYNYINNINLNNKEELIERISSIKEISKNTKLNRDEKWNEFKEFFEIMKNIDKKIGTYILEIILISVK